MDINNYEAAAFYGFLAAKNSGITDYPTRCMVFNADDFSSEVCVLSADGRLSSAGNYTPAETVSFQQSFFGALANILSITPGDAERLISGDLSGINRAMRNYYLSGADNTALSADGITLRCSDIERALENALRLFTEQIEETRRIAGPVQTGAAGHPFLLTGSAAAYYFVEYLFRKAISADPFIGDPYFMNGFIDMAPDRIAEAGRQAFEEAEKNRSADITVELVSAAGAGAGVTLSDKNTPPPAPANAEYRVNSVFVSAEDVFSLNVNGKKTEVALPFFIQSGENALVDLAVVKEDSEIKLAVRKSSTPAEVYTVNLNTGIA